MSSPTFGTGLIVGGAYFYPQTEDQKITSPGVGLKVDYDTRDMPMNAYNGRLVAFVGAGRVEDSFGNHGEGKTIPSYGVGLRWMVLESQRINVRVDFARSDDGHRILRGCLYTFLAEMDKTGNEY